MYAKLLGRLVLLVVCLLMVVGMPAAAQASPANRINHLGQDLFLSGINLAWINFARDLTDFDEPRFVTALDEIAAARGSTLRWWLHTDGSSSPIYGEDGRVIGLGEDEIEVMRRALDLAYERGILIIMCLWSHDMMNEREDVPTAWNQLLIEDPEYTQAYIDNVLVPMVTALAGHPGIVAWEVFNEPEGTTSQFGWTDARTEMPFIQQFVNLIAGAIHRADPQAKVTSGAWNFRVMTDVDGMFNYYRDDRLIEAGSDPDGTLDFYSVHYYPEWFDESTSPFHHPASYWELDKPIVVAEFPAAGLRDLGMGYLPRRELPDAIHTYPYLFETGYAGAVSWTYSGGPHGDLLDASSGMLHIANFMDAEAVTVDIGDVDHIPVVQQNIENVIVPNDTTSLEDHANLGEVFSDVEDGANLSYTITENSRPDVVGVIIGEDGALFMTFSGTIGTSTIEITATDSANHTAKTAFLVQVIDPNIGNVAIGKPTLSSSLESASYRASYATDGLLDTRWSTEYADPQWLVVDLENVYTVNQVILRWEAAYGEEYEIQAWDGSAWQTVYYEPLGDGGIDDLALAEPVDTRYIKMNGIRRGEQWGYSLWEFEVYGVRVESPDPVFLEAVPPEFGITADELVHSEVPVEMETTQLFSFEADAEGWGIVSFWTAITSLEHSDAMASDGSFSLAVTGTYSGTAWEEGGVFLALAEGTDWSAYDVLTVDVYAPEGAENFIAQVYMRTGTDFAWANTTDFPLVANSWNTLEADLSTLGDMTDVREVGIKIGTSVTALEGTFYIDNVRLLSSGG